jgi:hypothetical protein
MSARATGSWPITAVRMTELMSFLVEDSEEDLHSGIIPVAQVPLRAAYGRTRWKQSATTR